jgi:cell wall-associated NlpC family hydrolase
MLSCPTALALLALVAAALAGCATTDAARSRPQALPESTPISTAPLPDLPAPPDSGPVHARSDVVVMRALGLVGVRYRYGGNQPDSGIDCSGLVRWAYRDVPGVALPRATTAMYALKLPRVEPAALVPADLVFFRIGRQVSHVGIYIGEGRFVHAPSRGGLVRVDRLDDRYWKPRFAGARRALGGSVDPLR